ncbi:hypothetical protein LMH87_000090 [Akanthomyces muscarius]|uniref:DUF7357 domain-containing protein n=1 Tax=Akanthomyces muscarius TaxID=2231603 RepID=A0A9W8QDV3_AKAMU|nr:hypothetical protein LMH87_000090 [Akanthomyces muscarius]KAJ4154814.1 hypothetical protein LMH87_000090 [Akanthomyces muscarius]
MSFGDIRLRLVIRRHTVPDVKLVWPCAPTDDLTIAKLLAQVNEVVPLEGGEWGLEDYTVELGDGSNGASFECLHFQLVSRILKDEDQVLIRPLLSDDLKRRRRSGRHQISNGGKHLVDGIAFGRPWLHLPGDRPALELPPRKRARITYDDDDDDDDSDAASEFHADWDSNDELEGEDAELASGSSFEDEEGDDDLMQELELLKQDRRDISEASSDNEDVGFGLLPMLDSMAALRMAFPNLPSFIIQQELRRRNQDVRDAYKTLAQSYGPTLSFDEMMDSVLTASRPSNTPLAARFKSLGDQSPAQPLPGRRLIEVVESDGDGADEDENLNESGKVVGLGIRDVDMGSDSGSDSDDSSDSDSDSDSSGGVSYTQATADAEEGSDDESNDSLSDSDSDSSSDSDSGDEIAFAKSRNAAEAISRSESESESSDSDSSSSDESDAGPTEISTSRIQTLSKAVTPPTPSVVVPAVEPGCGLSRTQKRNARRKRSKQMHNSVNGSATLDESTPDEIMAALEARKAALLSSLGSETLQPEIPDSMTLEPLASEASDKAPIPATNGVDTQPNGESANPSPRRLNLNAGASRRLLFGALGLKAPKNKADEEKLKKDLMKGVKPLANKRLVEEVEEPAEPDTTMEDDSWREKISYRAVECCHDGIVLSEPPFPFVQRWDPQQQYSSMRKRKRQSQSHYEDYEDDSLVYDDPPAKTTSNKKKKKAQKSKSDGENESELPNDHTDDARVEEDLPPLPSDLTSLVPLTQDAVIPGQLVTWKQLSMSKATSWQPQMASFTGVILEDSDANSIKVVLARRDRETNEHVYDEHTGQRVYEKFEAPSLDDEEEDAGADDGHRTVSCRGPLSGKPSLDNEAETTAETQEAAQPKAKKKKTKTAAAKDSGNATTVVPSSLADDAQDGDEGGNVDMEMGDSLAEVDEALIPETLIDAAAAPALVPGLLNSSPFESLDELFVTASSSRPSMDATASSLPIIPSAAHADDAEYKEAMRRLDNGESDGEEQNLFPNATQPVKTRAGEEAVPEARSSPRRQIKGKKKSAFVVPEGSQVITLSSSPVQRRSPPAAARRAARRRSVSAQLHSEDEGSQKQRAKLRSRSGS